VTTSQNVLSYFAHQIRQPLSTIEALTSYLELITPGEDTRVREQLHRIHAEIAVADEILREGMRAISSADSEEDHSKFAMPAEGVVEELSLPRANAAIVSVT
jgi:signal transduction histidine kinase